MRIDIDIDDVMEQISDECLLEEVKARGLGNEIRYHEFDLGRLVNKHRLGVKGSEIELVRWCYDVVGKIV